jgi:hypothetical protein
LLTYDPIKGPFLQVMLSQSALDGTNRHLAADQMPGAPALPAWETAPLDQAVEITGSVELSLNLLSSSPDADLVASLAQVAPDGTVHQLVQGWINIPRAAQTLPDAPPGAPDYLKPGIARRTTISFMPTSVVVPAGHRLRLTLAGGTAVGQLPDGRTQPRAQGPGRFPQPFALDLQTGPDATLILPVVGDVPAVLRARSAR